MGGLCSSSDAHLPNLIQLHNILTRNLVWEYGEEDMQYTIKNKANSPLDIVFSNSSPKFLYPADHFLSFPLFTPQLCGTPSVVCPLSKTKANQESPFWSLKCVWRWDMGASAHPASSTWGLIILTLQGCWEDEQSWNSGPGVLASSSISLLTAVSRQQSIVES